MSELNYVIKNDEVWVGRQEQEFLEDKEIFIPNRYQGLPVVGIEKSAFWGSKAEEVIIEDGIRIIEETVFDNCRKLAKISIPESVTEIGRGAFEFCFSLQNIILPEKVEKIGWDTFEGCHNLRYVILPNDIKEIESGAFLGAGRNWDPTCEVKEEVIRGERKTHYIYYYPDKAKIRDKEHYGIKFWIPKSNFSNYLQELPKYSVLYYEGSEEEAAVEMAKYLNRDKVPVYEFYQYNVQKEEILRIIKD